MVRHHHPFGTVYLAEGIPDAGRETSKTGENHLAVVDVRDPHGGDRLSHDFALLPCMMRPPITALVIMVLMCLLSLDAALGQCVMCKAVAEDSASDGGLGRGLNAGILYLMAIPYALLAILGAVFFWKKKAPAEK